VVCKECNVDGLFCLEEMKARPIGNRKVNHMKKTLLALLMFFLVTTSVHAADKIRIGYPDFNSSTFMLPLAHIRGFFEEEGLQAELIRIRSAVSQAESAHIRQFSGDTVASPDHSCAGHGRIL